ncbi:hypothetical protein Q7C36_003665 [Tachysurus vachellii]|uniref:Uncharacterized protein n=1 Tax=Tachysurus vachellii TaxID=175792 RepID=A0AA88TFA5_TACVA|nr:hypothetical protein Q7C36_003665 [Tachysurus vachellii]
MHPFLNKHELTVTEAIDKLKKQQYLRHQENLSFLTLRTEPLTLSLKRQTTLKFLPQILYSMYELSSPLSLGIFFTPCHVMGQRPSALLTSLIVVQLSVLVFLRSHD